MSLTLKDLRIADFDVNNADDIYRPASLADLVEVLKADPDTLVVDFIECCENSDGKQMMSPHGSMISGNGECAEWLVPRGRYLVVRIGDVDAKY